MNDFAMYDATAKDNARLLIGSKLRDVSVARAQDPAAFLARYLATIAKDG